MNALDRARRNARELLQLFVVPFGLALLPWRLGFALVRWLATAGIGFRIETDAAWQAARRRLGEVDERRWRRDYRLTRWIERVDTGWTLTRSARWWRRRVVVSGALPPATAPGLLLTYHWGAGQWIWPLLRAHGIGAYFVARRPQVADFGAGRVAGWYARLRGWSLRRVGSLGPIYVGGSGARIGTALAEGRAVLGMLDLPARADARAQRVALLGAPARLPTGLLEVAFAQRARVTLLSCGLDIASGRRTLRVETLPPALDVEHALQRYAAHLEACLREAPAAWAMWHEAPAIWDTDDEPAL